jgi:hypothetical protein
METEQSELSNMEIQPNWKKVVKKTLLILFSIIILWIIALYVRDIYDSLFPYKPKLSERDLLIIPWEAQQKIGKSGLTISTPLGLKEIHESGYGPDFLNFSSSFEGFDVNVIYVMSKDGYFIDAGTDAIISEFEKNKENKNFQKAISKVQEYGLEGRIFQGSYEKEDKKYYFHGYIYSDNFRAWLIFCNYPYSKIYEEVAGRILGSVYIKK